MSADEVVQLLLAPEEFVNAQDLSIADLLQELLEALAGHPEVVLRGLQRRQDVNHCVSFCIVF